MCHTQPPAQTQASPSHAAHRYQRRRMYTRIALGKNSTMDVVAGDGVGAHGQLVFLYPLLFLLQVCACMEGG